MSMSTNLMIFHPSPTWGYAGGCLIVVADDFEDAKKVVQAYNDVENAKTAAHEEWSASWEKMTPAEGVDLDELWEEHERQEPKEGDPVDEPLEEFVPQIGKYESKSCWVFVKALTLATPQPKEIVFLELHTG